MRHLSLAVLAASSGGVTGGQSRDRGQSNQLVTRCIILVEGGGQYSEILEITRRHLEGDQLLAGEVPATNRKYTVSCCRYRVVKQPIRVTSIRLNIGCGGILLTSWSTDHGESHESQQPGH